MPSNGSSIGGSLFGPDTTFSDCAPWWYLGIFLKAWGGIYIKYVSVHFSQVYPPLRVPPPPPACAPTAAHPSRHSRRVARTMPGGRAGVVDRSGSVASPTGSATHQRKTGTRSAQDRETHTKTAPKSHANHRNCTRICTFSTDFPCPFLPILPQTHYL